MQTIYIPTQCIDRIPAFDIETLANIDITRSIERRFSISDHALVSTLRNLDPSNVGFVRKRLW